MTTEVKEGKKSTYRRMSDVEMGKMPPPKFQERDAEIWTGMKKSFPYKAELQARMGAGKTRYTSIDAQNAKLGRGKRQDYFDPTYGQCPYPSKSSSKDFAGDWNERCEFEIPVDGKGKVIKDKVPSELLEGYGDLRVTKGTIYEEISSLKQYIFMKHCELDHWEWYQDECGDKYKHADGKTYLRPPEFTVIPTPDWELA